jgi:hypothetical protein
LQPIVVSEGDRHLRAASEGIEHGDFDGAAGVFIEGLMPAASSSATGAGALTERSSSVAVLDAPLVDGTTGEEAPW